MKTLKNMITLFIITTIACLSCQARTYNYNGKGKMIGNLEFAIVDKNCNSLHDLARQYNTGYDALLDANPHLSSDEDLTPGLVVYIPNKIILPKKIKPNTILINTAEKRLFYYQSSTNTLYTFPVGVGRLDFPTPTGKMYITQKRYKPTWNVPPGVLAEAHRNGFMDHPTTMPYGPENPLGKYAIHLSAHSYLIHSTHNPDLIGTRNTSGCINLYPEHIAILYNMISVKTPVEIVNMPFKYALTSQTLYLERYPTLYDTSKAKDQANESKDIQSQISRIQKYAHVETDYDLTKNKLDNLTDMLQNPVGYPVAVVPS